VFSWPVFPFTIATKTVFCCPESVMFGLREDVLAAQNGRVAASQQLAKVGFTRFTTLFVLIRDTRVNSHPESKKSRKYKLGMLWGRMSTASKHITVRARLGLFGYLPSSLACA
jgi:hypothetical protein